MSISRYFPLFYACSFTLIIYQSLWRSYCMGNSFDTQDVFKTKRGKIVVLDLDLNLEQFKWLL